jgi:hypothetical protein
VIWCIPGEIGPWNRITAVTIRRHGVARTGRTIEDSEGSGILEEQNDHPAVVLVGIFVIGFVPSYLKAKRLEGNYTRHASRRRWRSSGIWLAGVSSSKPEGLRPGGPDDDTAVRRSMANGQPDGERRSIEGVLSLRDSITAKWQLRIPE